jgi:hypothetical protein
VVVPGRSRAVCFDASIGIRSVREGPSYELARRVGLQSNVCGVRPVQGYGARRRGRCRGRSIISSSLPNQNLKANGSVRICRLAVSRPSLTFEVHQPIQARQSDVGKRERALPIVQAVIRRQIAGPCPPRIVETPSARGANSSSSLLVRNLDGQFSAERRSHVDRSVTRNVTQ